MSEHRYWFEEVPEEDRYWFLAPSGMPPRLEAELRESGLTPQDAADLQDIERTVDCGSVFDRVDAGRARRDVVETRKRMEAVGYDSLALEPPWWPMVRPWVHEQGHEYVSAPILYTKREMAEGDRRSLEEGEPERYLQLVEDYGQERTDEAISNTPPYKDLWVDRGTLLYRLEDSTFLCVMMDGVLKLRRDLIEDLRRDEGEAG